MKSLTRCLAGLAAVLIAMVASTAPALAAATYQPGNCNNNYDLSPAVYTLVVRAPKITSKNGTAQIVRYRSILYKAPPAGGTFVLNTYGVWRSGTAYPTTPWQDASRTWNLSSAGAGYYRVNIQVQYKSAGAWTSTSTVTLISYYQNMKSGGTWTAGGTVPYCHSYN